MLLNLNLNDSQRNLTNNPSPQNAVFSEIVKEIFGDVQQYETDVPQNFERPCVLFINPDKTTRTKEMTASSYKIIQNYEIYFFATEDDIEALTSYKDSFVDYLMGLKKIPIPNTERYYTVEQVAADTDDVNSMVAFVIEVSRICSRDLRRSAVSKIERIVNRISIDGRNTRIDE